MDDVDAYALFGGEDYELLFTVTPEDVQKIDDMEGVSVIGTMEEASKGVRAYSPDTGLMPLHPAGYQHFDGPAGSAPDDGDFEDTGLSGDGL
jgi:thiamine-monophosphate kinase